MAFCVTLHFQYISTVTVEIYRQTNGVLYSRHRAINLFLETYSQQWLESSEDHTSSALGHELLDHQDYLVTHKTASLPPHHRDPLTQLFTMIKRKATTGEWLAHLPYNLYNSKVCCFLSFPSSLDHELFIAYPNVLSKVCIITCMRSSCVNLWCCQIITGVRNDERITGEENVTVAYQVFMQSMCMLKPHCCAYYMVQYQITSSNDLFRV